MKRPPTVEDLFNVMAAASVGDESARVAIPDEPDPEEPATRLGIALNLLLDDLAQRKREAEHNAALTAATAEKEKLLAMMSHEIRTPLNGVIGMTSILLSTELQQNQREMLEVVRRSGQHLLAIINDILDFSRMEASRLVVERYPFDPRQCVEDVVEIVAAQAAEKGLEVVYEVDESTPRVLAGDAGRLRQVLLNLVGNAVKFTDRGEVVIRADARPIENGEHEIHFRVQDTGVGIAPDRLPGLFRPFVQVDATVARQHGGTGLGLAIVKRLCELMGGRAWAESTAGKGSIFHFTIRASEAQLGGPEEGASPRLGHRILIIVDDNATSREFLSKHVQAWGMAPHAFATGEEALRKLRGGERFDAIIIDYQMPGMDGLALARKVRELPSARLLPMILLVPLTMPQRDLPVRELNIAAVLPKPLRASQLYNALVAIFEPERAIARPARAARALDPAFASRHPLGILVVEDNTGNQMVALRMLEGLGFRADLAASGLEAVDAVARRPYDVILMDLQMPGIDGHETARRILAKPAAGTIQIIALTADARSEERQRCLEEGMVDYILKPLVPENVVPSLERAWARSQETAPAIREAALDQLRNSFRVDAVRGIVESYVSSVAPLLAELHGAVAGGKAKDVERIGHTLKSTGVRLGAQTIERLGREIEEIGRTGSMEGVAAKLSLAEKEWPRAREAVEAWLGKLPGT